MTLIGQQRLLDAMRSAILADRIGHAIIISGPWGSGKRSLGRMLTQMLMCENHGPVKGEAFPCGHCPGCKKVLSGNHADVKTIAPAKGYKSLRVEEVAFMQQNMMNRAYEGGKRVYLLQDAHLLTAQAQNKLLKTLEEPPQGVVIFLLAEHTAALLPTVISRCRQIRMERVAPSVMEATLVERWDIPRDKARHAASAGDGWVGAALQIAADEEYWKLRQVAWEMLEQTPKPGGALRIMALAEPYKTLWPRLIVLWQGMLRDAALLLEGQDILNPDMKDRLWALNEALGEKRLQDMWQASHEAQQRLAGNANGALTMDWLLSRWEGCEDHWL